MPMDEVKRGGKRGFNEVSRAGINPTGPVR